MAIGRKTGGRQKGTPNRATKQREEVLARGGVTPLSYMLNVLRSDESTEDQKRWAAEKAAPYVHPRLTQIDAKLQAELNERHMHVHVIDVRGLPVEKRDELRRLLLTAAVQEAEADAIEGEFEEVEEGDV